MAAVASVVWSQVASHPLVSVVSLRNKPQSLARVQGYEYWEGSVTVCHPQLGNFLKTTKLYLLEAESALSQVAFIHINIGREYKYYMFR